MKAVKHFRILLILLFLGATSVGALTYYQAVNHNESTNPKTQTTIDNGQSANEQPDSTKSTHVKFILAYSSGIGGRISGETTQTVDEGDSGSKIIAVPNIGYHFVKWNDNNSTDAIRIDSDIHGNINANALFDVSITDQKQKETVPEAPTTPVFNTYTVTLNAGTGGSVSGGGTYSSGSSQTITATADTDYSFSGWSGDSGCSGLASHTITVDNNKTCTASFTPTPITVPSTPTVSALTTGSSTTYSWNSATCGGDSTARYQYDYTVSPLGSDSGLVVTAATSIGFTTSTTDQIYTVTVQAQCYNSVTSSTWSAAGSASYHPLALTYTASSGGSITGTSSQVVNYGDDGITVTATPDPGHHFVQWSDNNSTNAARTDTNVTAGITTMASFAINTYTITESTDSNGTITPSGVTSINYGVSQTFTITPNSGYHIADVLVDGSSVGAVSSYAFTDVITSHTISASFAPNSTVAVSSISPTSGNNIGSVNLTSITGSGFLSGAAVKLTQNGQADVSCTGFTVASSTSITGGSCHTTNANPGVWNVVVTNADAGTGSLVGGFNVNTYNIGDTGPAGGLIFYINPNYVADGWRYLEAAPSDYNAGTTIAWISPSGFQSTLIGTTSTAIGTGLVNTNNISSLGATRSSTAADVAKDSSINGLTDWFLPSQQELYLMYTNLYKHVPSWGGFNASGYWSSSEDSSTNAWRESFSGTTWSTMLKTSSYRVRAIRRFWLNTTHAVTYNGNGNTGGSVPSDSNLYQTNDIVPVAAAGNLAKSGYSFSGWNTAADGSGTSYAAGANITMASANVTLYAQWYTPNFTIAIMPDEQSYAKYKPAIISSQVDWFINNKVNINLKFVSHEGDIVADWDQNTDQWLYAQQQMQRLVAAGVDCSALPGNHDYAMDTRDSTMFNSYLPLSSFSSMPEYGGSYDGVHSDNTYYIVDVNGQKLLILSLEFGPRDEVLTWADGVLKAHSNTQAIIVTHSYLNTDGSLLAYPNTGSPNVGYGFGTDVNDGQQMWDKLVYPNNNVRFVFGGHVGTVINPSAIRESTHADGSSVHQILANYQAFPVNSAGQLLLLNFSSNQVNLKTYSPWLSAYTVNSSSQATWTWSF